MTNSPQDESRIFNPPPDMAAQIATNRAGNFTRGQRVQLMVGAGGSLLGLLFMILWVSVVVQAIALGVPIGNWVSALFFVFFVLTFAYLFLTLYFNASWFLPDLLSKTPIKQAQGKLKIQMAARERPMMPFSYIVDDYSFAPFMVPYEVPMDEGREYIVYYAAHSRIFLSVEPVQYAPND